MRPHSHVVPRLALVAAAVFSLSACGGGGGGSALLPGGSQTTPQSGPTTSLIVQGSISTSGGPQILGHVRRLPRKNMLATPAATFSKISVTGTLYPADASGNPISNTITISPPSGGTYTAAVPFANVPVHNNEWAVLQFTGVAANGSTIALGELAGLINAGSNTNSTTLTNATTLQWETFAMLAAAGVIGTYDLDHNATLATTIQNGITATGAQPDPTTGIFQAPVLVKLYTTLAPQFERDMTITPGNTSVKNIVIVRDYTNTAELNYTSNVSASASMLAVDFLGASSMASTLPNVVGGSMGLFGCGGFYAGVSLHTPGSTGPVVPAEVSSCVIPTTGAITIRNIYGGQLLIGATNNPMSGSPGPLPFIGGWKTQAGRAVGSASLSVPMANTNLAITVTDPVGFAYGATAFQNEGLPLFSVQPAFGNTPLASTHFVASTLSGGTRYTVPANYSASANTVTVDSFNAWNIAKANMALCGGITCNGLTATQPFAITRTFMDLGSKLAYRNWTVGGVASKITASSGMYFVQTSGAGDGTLTSTVSTTLVPQQHIVISNSLATGALWTVTATDNSNNTYTNSGTNTYGGATVTMYAVGGVTTMKQIVIKFHANAATTFTFGPVLDETEF